MNPVTHVIAIASTDARFTATCRCGWSTDRSTRHVRDLDVTEHRRGVR